MARTFALRLLVCILLVMVTDEGVASTLGPGPQLAQDSRPSQARPRKRPSTAVQQQLRRADQLFQARDYERALFLYTQILKRNPEQTTARINLARCLYKLARFEDAYQAFKSLKLEELDPDSRYEAGQSALKMKDFAGALEAFKSVPNGHPLYDLANYYGAICASNLRDYKQAADLMRQAVVLPSKLTPSKKAYLQHIQEMITQQGTNTATQTPPLTPREFAETVSPYGPGFGQSPLASLRAGFRSTIQNQKFDESDKIRHGRQEPYLEWLAAKRLPINNSQQGEAPHKMLLHLRLNLTQIDQSKRKLRLLEDERGEIRRLFLSQSQSDHELVSEIDTGIMPQWHIGQDIWFLVGGQFLAVSPGLDISRSFSHLIGIVGLGIQMKDYEAVIRFRLIDTAAEAKRQYTRTQQEFDLTLLPQARFSIGIQAILAQYAYSQAEVDGPDSLALFRLESRLRISTVVSIGIGGHIEQLDGQRLHGIGELPVISYHQSASGGHLDLQVEPLAWLKLAIGIRTQDRLFEDISPNNPETALVLRKTEASHLFEISSQAVLEWQF